jgi:type III pantothenate kinase
MLLAIDAGNTNICFAVYDDDKQVKQWRIETDKFHTIDGELLDIQHVVVCSVVPKVNDALIKACERQLQLTPVFLNHENAVIDINIDNPAQLGTDRIASAIGASVHYQYPCIIADFGTSTNFDIVDKNGSHIGGVLATGARLSLKALSDAAAQLPEIKIEKPPSVIGKNTVDAMQSGIYWGYVAMVEGIIDKITQEMEQKPFVIATGGLAVLFERGTDVFDAVDQDLIMKGLVHMHKHILSN